MNILAKTMSAVLGGVLLGTAATLTVLPGKAFADGIWAPSLQEL